MTSLLTILEPFTTPLNAQFFGLLALAILGLLFCFLLLTKRLLPKLRLRGLLGMLAGFIGVVCLGATLLSAIHARHINPLVFEKDSLSFGPNTLKYKQIERHYIKRLPQQSRYSAQITTDTALIYVIEMRDKSSHLFSNDYYDLRKIGVTLEKYVVNR